MKRRDWEAMSIPNIRKALSRIKRFVDGFDIKGDRPMHDRAYCLCHELYDDLVTAEVEMRLIEADSPEANKGFLVRTAQNIETIYLGLKQLETIYKAYDNIDELWR